jgi:hypothetical protein
MYNSMYDYIYNSMDNSMCDSLYDSMNNYFFLQNKGSNFKCLCPVTLFWGIFQSFIHSMNVICLALCHNYIRTPCKVWLYGTRLALWHKGI